MIFDVYKSIKNSGLARNNFSVTGSVYPDDLCGSAQAGWFPGHFQCKGLFFLSVPEIGMEQGTARKANDSSLTLSTPPWHTYAFTLREPKKRKEKRESGETTHLLSVRRLSWSLRLGLYIGLAPTDWKPSIFSRRREETVHGDQNVSRSWLYKSKTSASCVRWLYTLAEIFGNA